MVALRLWLSLCFCVHYKMTHSINGLYHGLRDKCERINLEVTDIVHYLWTRIRTAVETREIGGQRTSLHLILML